MDKQAGRKPIYDERMRIVFPIKIPPWMHLWIKKSGGSEYIRGLIIKDREERKKGRN